MLNGCAVIHTQVAESKQLGTKADEFLTEVVAMVTTS